VQNKILKIDDINGKVYEIDNWKEKQAPQLKNYFDERIDEIKTLYEELLDNYKWNKIIYESRIMFKPVIGKKYHLYQNDNGKRFLSLISPSDWNLKKNKMNFIGTFKQDTQQRWNIVRINKENS
tara:strand:- start:153 stop:524 length:372 start_codon:yes stop_codon:yes gene_type:complete